MWCLSQALVHFVPVNILLVQVIQSEVRNEVWRRKRRKDGLHQLGVPCQSMQVTGHTCTVVEISEISIVTKYLFRIKIKL